MKCNKKKSIVFSVLLVCSAVVVPITPISANTKQNAGAIEVKTISSSIENTSTIFQEQKVIDANTQDITPVQEEMPVVTEVVEKSTAPVVEKAIVITPVVSNPLCPNNPNCDSTNHDANCDKYVNCPNNANCNGVNHNPNCNGNRHNNGQHNQNGRGHQERSHRN